MGEIAIMKVAAKNFQGMATNVDPNDLKPGVAQLQVNITGHRMAELEVRQGLREFSFETE